MVETDNAASRERAVRQTAPIAIITAVPQETEPLQTTLEESQSLLIGKKPARTGILEVTPVIVLAAGMGKANAAQALTALLETHRIGGVLNVGVAGAYPGSGLEIGGVALATEEVYGDEGVLAPAGWLSTEAIGIPLLETATARHFNRFPLDPALVERARLRLGQAGLATATGRFVTVSCCSGTSARGVEIAERFGALCESMEGAALAQVSTLYGVPFLEVRAISNLVEDRDLSRWRLPEAIEAACRAARTLLPAF